MNEILQLQIGQEMEENPPVEAEHTLSTNKYTIEFSDGPSKIFAFDASGQKSWVCSASDPATAMKIIEGLILVEHKRFYYPESTPQVKIEKGTPVPSFLKKG